MSGSKKGIDMMRRKPELLVPASSLEVLKVAVTFGADAVYIGGEAFGLRAKAKNFSMEDMAEGIRFAHEHGVKVYVTANILAHNDDLDGARAYFEELKAIYDGCNHPDKLRVCFDTCHVNDAGYDLVNDYENVMNEFDKIIGLNQIAAFHINDSKNPLGAAKDRHENFGKGYLGSDALMQIIRDSRFETIPKILETPYIKDPENPKKSTPPYKDEIAWIKKQLIEG